VAFLYVTISIYEPTDAYSNVSFRPDVTFLVIADVIRKRIPAIATKITIIKRGGMVRRTRVMTRTGTSPRWRYLQKTKI
jgi:hypothetical protein